MRSAPTITFEVKPSRLLMLAVGCMAVVALAAVALSRLPWPAQAGLAVVVVAYAGVSIQRLRRQPLRRVGWHADDTWTLHLIGGRETTGRLVGGRVLGPLIVLRLAWAGGGHSALTLLPDSVDAEVRRHLRMRLSALADEEKGA